MREGERVNVLGRNHKLQSGKLQAFYPTRRKGRSVPAFGLAGLSPAVRGMSAEEGASAGNHDTCI
eukprot:495691-Rhodomonas_salina.1